MQKLLLIIVLFINISVIYAQTEYTIGISDADYSPMLFTQNGLPEGYFVDLLVEFEKTQRIHFNFKIFPTNRLNAEYLINKNLDFKYPDNLKWTYELKLNNSPYYSEPIIYYAEGIMVISKKVGKIKTLKVIGTMRGFTVVPYLEEIENKEILVAEANSISALIQMCLAERVEGIFANESIIKYNLKKMNLDDKLVLDTTLKSTTGYYALSTIKYPGIIKSLNSFIKNNPELIIKLKKKWYLN